jgi:hypothetical protein
VYTGYRKNIVVLILTLGCGVLYGQETTFQPNSKQTAGFKDKPFTTTYLSASINKSHISPSGSIPPFIIGTARPNPAVSGLEKDLYVKGFGFFCKKEMQIEKSVKLPLRFRLGSLEQCNILEQKH